MLARVTVTAAADGVAGVGKGPLGRTNPCPDGGGGVLAPVGVIVEFDSVTFDEPPELKALMR